MTITNEQLTKRAEDPVEEPGPEVVVVDETTKEDGKGGLIGKVIDFATGKGRGRVEEPKPKVTYPDEVVEEARKYIDEEFIVAGGDWREDQRHNVYWLPLPELIEFEKADKRIPTDREFWDWFKGFRELRSLEKRKKKSRVDWQDSWDNGYQGSKWNDTGSHLTRWWSNWGYNIGSTLERDLAIALGAITTTVSVINTTGKRFRVRLADDSKDKPMSATFFDEQLVIVSPQALLDTSIEKDLGIEITTGYGLHEASHIRDTMPIIDVLQKPTELRPRAVAGMVLNVLEDVKIEAHTSEMFPGFTQFFEKANAYLWDVTKMNAPKEWGPELGDKVNAIVASMKWPTEYRATAEANDGLKVEFEWFLDLRNRYLDGLDPREAVIQALMHLAEDEETKQQLQQQAREEKQYEEDQGKAGRQLTEKEFDDLLKELEKRLHKGRPSVDPCPSPGFAPGSTKHKIELTPNQARQIEKLVGQELEEHDSIVKMVDMYGKGEGPKVLSLRPEEDAMSRAYYRAPGALVQRLRATFVFRKAAPMYSNRLLKSGSLDEEQLYRVLGNDFRVFEQRVIEDQPDAQVSLLVDLSGSMGEDNGRKLEIAQEMANTVLECLKTMKGVRVRVRGHTTNARGMTGFGGNDEEECQIFRLWEPGDPQSRIGLIKTIAHQWNYDGFAIEWCAREMIAEQRPGEDMVLIVLSDGKPNARGFAYSGRPAMDHVRMVTDTYERKGVTTIQIAIDPELRSDDQARMFKNWIQYESDVKLPNQLGKLLVKLFGG